MARIRSVHPGLFTDDAFIELSMVARLLLIGIWTEAFDDGVFEWKPKRLKVRIFPADDVCVETVLAELAEHGCVKSVQSKGKTYGLVRNFCKFQRPKKPNSSGVMTDEFGTYVGLPPEITEASSPPVPHQSRTGSEKPIQKGGREDGGREDVTEKTTPDGVVQKLKPKKSPPRTKIIEGWFPEPEGFAFAQERGLIDTDIYDEIEKFSDYHRAKGTVMADWNAAWRTWVQNHLKFEQERKGKQSWR